MTALATPRYRWFVLAVLILAAVQLFVVTRPFNDWWFEDDTPHRVFVRDHSNPLAYFTDDELVRKLSLGHAVTPWFPFTFWLDHQFAPLDARPAYIHTGLSLVLTALLLFAFITRWSNPWSGLLGAGCWLFLPSTVTITEFLSTRHYLEGLALSLAACLCASHGVARDNKRWPLWFAACFYLLATTTKEVYVSGTFAALLVIYGWHRRWRAALGIVACGLLYAGYRLWALGLIGKNVGAAVLTDYHLFPMRMPYLFAGNWGGVAIALLCLMALVMVARRSQHAWQTAVAVCMVSGALLVTIFPVTANVVHQYQALGTWYRVLFLWNTALIIGVAWLLHATAHHHWRTLAVVTGAVTFLVVSWGSLRAAEGWDTRKLNYTMDGAFYLQHPDRLLYSDLPAPWFLYGLHHMYQPLQPPHYITWRVDAATPKATVLERIQQFDNLWLRQDSRYQERSDLRPLLRQRVEAGITPLLPNSATSP